MQERRMDVMKRQRPGTIAGFGGSSHYDPKKAQVLRVSSIGTVKPTCRKRCGII
jgi:hypothetical protein